MLNRAVFMDRDGVINRAVVTDGKSYPPATLEAFEILPGVAATIDAFRAAGLKTIVATNQPDVTAGKQTLEVVEAMHARLLNELAIDDIKVCYCFEGSGCDCYKPKPGMLVEAADEWQIDLAESFLVGDRWRDIGAGKAVGCETYCVDYGYQEKRPVNPDYTVASLYDAGQIILEKVRTP